MLNTEQPLRAGQRGRAWIRLAAQLAVVAVLLCLAALNIAGRAAWSEMEDGVLWAASTGGLTAREIAAGSPAERAGLRVGDVLMAIDRKPVDSIDDVVAALHAASDGQALSYTVLRMQAQALIDVAVAPIPSGPLPLYYVLASVGIFALLVGASVRLRRPENQATLHFFWLSIAFFGVLAFSFSGRLDLLDLVFYWADVVAMLLLPPLFVHFALVFPERPGSWARSDAGRTLLPVLYLPALLLFGARLATIVRGGRPGEVLSRVITLVERAETLCLAAGLIGGLVVMSRALGHVRSVTARRQLRWIVWGTAFGAVPFVLGYGLPFAFGFTPLGGFEFTAVLLALVPLAFASAIVRYRLMDVEVIIKRGLVYAAALAGIAAIYSVLLKLASEVFFSGEEVHNTVIALLATVVVVLLARPLKNAIQAGLDRVYYRDRYDYRRALVGFARDLNSDLDLLRLSDRLVHRVTETLVVDRMALLLAPAAAGREGEFVTIAHTGFPGVPPALPRASEVGTRLLSGHTLTLDDPLSQRRIDGREIEFWRDAGIHYFIPCVSKEGAIAIMALGRKASAEPLSSEDMALLAAVAAQAATALENGRLYRQLRVKADELQRLREFSENILESLNDGLAVVDRDDVIVRWNRRLEELYGVRHEDAVGHRADEVFDQGFFEVLRSARRDSSEGAAFYRVPLATRHAPVRRLLVNVATTPLRDSGEAIAGTIIIVEDISTRVQLEEQLQISEKMASLGLLAAGVAHEVNTPLTGISSFAQMLLQGADPDDPKTQVLEKIERQTFRAAKIVNGLLNLARPAQVDSGPVDLHAVINDVLSLLEHQLRSGSIQVRKELSATAPIVQGIEYKLQQVFLNLLLNARDAMPKGGWLTIVTCQGATEASVEIGDTGSGIPAEQLSRIYDPFFTTKDIGKGTGLGLSITYGIVQEHGGAITCHSSVGQGTRFSLTLPLASARQQAGRSS
ncbi:MAG: PAS domain S-box protein [Acidobacteria bacterium]|nr:PAS domain S-box protein [Acidobacteriota bacterium]MCA1649459.1 PAS domain S-box protein [Acidobacteriota bacterium]